MGKWKRTTVYNKTGGTQTEELFYAGGGVLIKEWPLEVLPKI
jgi:hypothetical protein